MARMNTVHPKYSTFFRIIMSTPRFLWWRKHYEETFPWVTRLWPMDITWATISLDHKYHYFFLNDRYLMNWVGQARDFIEQALQVQTIGFRSPFGIRTPHLGMALRELQYPLVLWNQRFFLIHGEAFPEPSFLRSYPNSNPGTFFYCMTRISSINDHFLRV